MSSRADMIGSGPSSGHYQAGPTPTEEKSMPTYINDELLALGGIVNGILEGGAFPPQGKMPVRWREGMMMYFTEPLEDTYVVGPYRGQRIITSAGVWLYRRSRWWKIIDDPSSITGAVFAYRLTADGTPPSTPSPSSAPPSGWVEVAPVKNSKSEWIWVTMSAAYDENTDIHTWSQPTPFSAGVVDGIDGEDGQDGAPGLDGRIFEQWFQEAASIPQVPSNVYPPPSPWSTTPPANPTNPVWMTFIKVREDGTDPVYPWSFPQKITGTDGEDGDIGPTGPPGEDGTRGTLNVSKAISGSSWSNLEAYNAIVNDPNSDGVVRYWDTVTLFNSVNQFSETRYYTGGTGSSSTWQPVELFVDGDAIINGTIAANKLVANTITAAQIAAGTITGNEINSGTRITIGGTSGQDVVILDASDANSRIWVGNTTSTSANFRVTPTGDLYANNGYFGGEVTYQGITGAIGGAVESGSTSPTPDWSEWFVDSGAATPVATMARVTIPRQNYDRIAVVTCIPSLLVATSRTNVDRFGIEWTAANSTGSTSNYHYRVAAVTETGSGYSTTGNSSSAFEFVAQNVNQSWFKLTNTLAWEVFIPATTSTGNLTIDLKAQFLHATGQTFPVTNFVTFKVPDSTVQVEVSKVNSGISIIN